MYFQVQYYTLFVYKGVDCGIYEILLYYIILIHYNYVLFTTMYNGFLNYFYKNFSKIYPGIFYRPGGSTSFTPGRHFDLAHTCNIEQVLRVLASLLQLLQIARLVSLLQSACTSFAQCLHLFAECLHRFCRATVVLASLVAELLCRQQKMQTLCIKRCSCTIYIMYNTKLTGR